MVRDRCGLLGVEGGRLGYLEQAHTIEMEIDYYTPTPALVSITSASAESAPPQVLTIARRRPIIPDLR